MQELQETGFILINFELISNFSHMPGKGKRAGEQEDMVLPQNSVQNNT